MDRAHAAEERTGLRLRVLVTGGLGYIGSHTCVALAEAGHDLVIVDNLSNAKRSVLERLRGLTGRPIEFHELDIRDGSRLAPLLSGMSAVLHFAGLKSVGESVRDPLSYYDQNVRGSVVLLQAMAAAKVPLLVFSSSATVYGEPAALPLGEDHPLRPASPYGTTKLLVERMLADVAAAGRRLRYAALRYFNPVGAHESGRIGEDPRGQPENLFPYVARVAVGALPKLRVFGNDYGTKDGTGVRDFIHVMDLAAGHVKALERLANGGDSFIVNLGTGRGYSVLEVIQAFERASGRPVPTEIVPRRPGDVSSSFADPSRAATLLGWRAKLGLDEMCRDGWRWQSQNPGGYP